MELGKDSWQGTLVVGISLSPPFVSWPPAAFLQVLLQRPVLGPCPYVVWSFPAFPRTYSASVILALSLFPVYLSAKPLLTFLFPLQSLQVSLGDSSSQPDVFHDFLNLPEPPNFPSFLCPKMLFQECVALQMSSQKLVSTLCPSPAWVVIYCYCTWVT